MITAISGDKVYPTEILSTDGVLQKIEFHDENKNFIIEAVWDPNDKPTPENYDLFRKWAYNFMRSKGYIVEVPKTKLGVIKNEE